MTAKDELAGAVSSVSATLDAHRVPYFVTGSLAASTHAEFRATNDIDIVADFATVDLRALMRAIDADFLADAEQAVSYVPDGQSFNLIHKTTFLKVDFFPAVSVFDRTAIERAQLVVLDEGGGAIRVATRENILLSKLRMVSARRRVVGAAAPGYHGHRRAELRGARRRTPWALGHGAGSARSARSLSRTRNGSGMTVAAERRGALPILVLFNFIEELKAKVGK